MTVDELGLLLGDPARAATLSPKERANLYRQVARLEADLRALIIAEGPGAEASRDETPDRLLTAAEVGPRLGHTRDWVYRHADALPFTVRILGGRPRFSAQGLARYLRSHQRGP
jgi:hypothetical protein